MDAVYLCHGDCVSLEKVKSLSIMTDGHGHGIRLGENVFINYNGTMLDGGLITIGETGVKRI